MKKIIIAGALLLSSFASFASAEVNPEDYLSGLSMVEAEALVQGWADSGYYRLYISESGHHASMISSFSKSLKEIKRQKTLNPDSGSLSELILRAHARREGFDTLKDWQEANEQEYVAYLEMHQNHRAELAEYKANWEARKLKEALADDQVIYHEREQKTDHVISYNPDF